jgi:deoxycytidylate deaminase
MRQIDNQFIKLAEKISKNSSCKYQHGAVIVRNKDIVSVGINRLMGFDQTLTRFGLVYSLHSEMDAIRKEHDIPNNSTMYVARSKYRSSKPCEICMRVIKKTNIKRVVFSNAGNMEEIIL